MAKSILFLREIDSNLSRSDALVRAEIRPNALFYAGRAVIRNFVVPYNNARVPIVKPYLFAVAIKIIHSKLVENVVLLDEGALEPFLLHDVLGFLGGSAQGNPILDLLLEFFRIPGDAAGAKNHGKGQRQE
jgi:hypothetical protein